MIPEIWLPTVTMRTGLSAPLAVTAWTISPRVTALVRNSGGAAAACRWDCQRQAA